MAVRDLARKLTYEDYVLIPEDGQRRRPLRDRLAVYPASGRRLKPALYAFALQPDAPAREGPPGAGGRPPFAS